ncbi:MAG TPA: hypothetical protein VMS74_14180 [Acidimicrobiia bacterium]|nr:hypothetical protein [Acidimicrobiia bacterium]
MFEQVGIPATAIVTHVFRPIAQQTAIASGFDVDLLTIVEHPIFTRSEDWFADLVDVITPAIVHKMTEGRPSAAQEGTR